MNYRVAVLILSIASISYAALTCKPWSCSNIGALECAEITATEVKINEDGCSVEGCTIEYIASHSSIGIIPCESEYEGGQFSFLSTYNSTDTSVSGRAQMRRKDGKTTVKLSVQGLDAGEYFAAHVHTASCASGGSGHYMNDPDGLVDKWNEIWPSFDTSDTGLGYAETEHDYVARPDALSVIIHDTPNATSGSGDKMLCADLVAMTDNWDDTFEADEEAYEADFVSKPERESSEKGEKEASPSYTCSAQDTGYRLAEGSYPKTCGVADSDGNPQPDTSLCTLSNGQTGACSCSMDGNYYCVPSEYDNTNDDLSWYWDDCDDGKMADAKRAHYLSQLSLYPHLVKFDDTLDDCKDEFKDSSKWKLSYKLGDDEDDNALMLALCLLFVFA